MRKYIIILTACLCFVISLSFILSVTINNQTIVNNPNYTYAATASQNKQIQQKLKDLEQ